MSSLRTDPSLEPSPEVRREAAVWIARIHSPDRAPPVETGLRRWLAESAEHRRAFELANELWEVASRIPDGALPRLMRWKRVAPASSARFPRAAAFGAAAAVLIALGAAVFFWRDPVLTTNIGEQRTVTLEDGTRVSLNTATQLVVQYDDRRRSVQLKSGEALFDVSRDPNRPFVVTAGGRSIEVLGTSFIVRRDPTQTAVTLVEGKIAVTPTRPVSAAPVSSDRVILSPGERATFPTNAPAPTLDRPTLEKLTAWQRGLVALDRTPLSDAVAEMNRYSAAELVIDSPEAAQARISGVFRAGESLSFAQAIARTYRLAVSEQPGRIVISGTPSQPQ